MILSQQVLQVNPLFLRRGFERSENYFIFACFLPVCHPMSLYFDDFDSRNFDLKCSREQMQ